MVVGQSNKEVLFIIQARMKSTRLPGKILLPLPLGSDKPLLLWIIEELKKSTWKHKIIVATSINPENDIIANFCANQDVICFRGDEDDVLSRFTTIAKEHNSDYIVRLTSDNPILDIELLDQTIDFHDNNSNDYTKTDNLPIGMNFEIVTQSALLDIENHNLTNEDREHVTLFLRNNNKYTSCYYKFEVNSEFSSFRLTTDYASDYCLMSTLMSIALHLDIRGLKLIEYVSQNYPWVFQSNLNNIQKRQFKNIEEEISAATLFLKEYDYNKTANILESLNVDQYK